MSSSPVHAWYIVSEYSLVAIIDLLFDLSRLFDKNQGQSEAEQRNFRFCLTFMWSKSMNRYIR